MTDSDLAAPRPPARRILLTGIALASTLLTGCTTGTTGATGATGAGDGTLATVTVTGPLCDLLPSDGEPGDPASLVDQPADRALQWIPVLTTFEAAVRATGLAEELTGEVTVLAPTDDAFAAKFSRTNLDELLLRDTDELRGLVRDHLVAGALPVADLVAAGTVTTVAGTRLSVTGVGQGARLDDRAETVCADYRAVGARIHVINAVLGDLPTTAGQDDDGHPAH
ncbi:fasciclin domain-containing protein [Micromonospora sp. CP22]|uniref:fasciclin domain-containing protein n=1 Tax=Micromonospora sp. CP22 TaxID=2580517 RepID=UPI0012BBFE2B|nr:fasciclin domain-containing protein [Micromonospora sp. CP22]MTK04111.1 fasciclin domain-containing protein [Micromonospora sp. CP22]